MIKLRNFGWLLRVGILSSLILPPVIATAQQPLLETIVGIQKADKMGKSIARADVDGDGFMDIIAGAPEGDVYKPTKNGYDDGYVAVFSGDDFEALAVYVGPNEDARLGTSIDRVGDLNGDGTEEIIIGAPGVEKNGTDSGAVYVVSIEPWQYLYQIYGEKQGDNLGHAVAGMGDLNDDGVPDFAYSAPGSDDAMINAGSVYVISGADGSLIRKFNGTSIDDQMGSSLRGIRDLDGDNRLELAVGSHLWDGASKNVGNVSFYNVINGVKLASVDGDKKGDEFGSAIDSFGDINQDGIPDILVGIPRYGSGNKGAVRVLSGKDASTLLQVDGNAAGYRLGTSVAYAGDITQDGIVDFVAGAPGAGGKDNNGKVLAFSGATGAELFQLKGKKGDLLGEAVMSYGATFDEGDELEWPNIAVGVPNFGGKNFGAVKVFSTNPCTGQIIPLYNKKGGIYIGKIHIKGCLAAGNLVTFEVEGPPDTQAIVQFAKKASKKGQLVKDPTGVSCTWHLKNTQDEASVPMQLDETGFGSSQIDLTNVELKKQAKIHTQALFVKSLPGASVGKFLGCSEAAKLIVGKTAGYE